MFITTKICICGKTDQTPPSALLALVFKEALYNTQFHFHLSSGGFSCTIPHVYHFGFEFELFQSCVNVGIMRNDIHMRNKDAVAKDGYEQELPYCS